MKKKGVLFAAISGSALMLLTGCSIPQKDTTKYKVAMITDTGGVNDQAFNQLAWEGLQKFSEESGAEVSYIESKQASDYVTNMDRATDGFNDLIWGTGFAMADPIVTISKLNPDISFALIDNQVPDAPFNVTSVVFRAEEPSFKQRKLIKWGTWVRYGRIPVCSLNMDMQPAWLMLQMNWGKRLKFRCR